MQIISQHMAWLSKSYSSNKHRSGPLDDAACQILKVSEYDQEVPRSHTADQPTAP